MPRRASADLVTAARRGDQDAWRDLYARHARRLTTWLTSLPQADTASSSEDIAADAWLTAAAKIGEYAGSDDDFGGWLFTIARNHASNRYRTAVRRRTDAVAVEAGTQELFGSHEDPLGAVDSQADTRRLLSHLSPREAQVVACIDVVGLDVSATAMALDMKPTAVRVARHRALGRLRRVLAETDDALASTTDEPGVPPAPA